MKPRTKTSSAGPRRVAPSPKVRPERSGPLHVEIVAVGRELLRGRRSDANARTIAAALASRGGLVHRITIVDDNERAIRTALLEALGRHPHFVITTGGLGPAPDDRTLAAVGEALGLPLVLHPRAQAMVEEAYRRLHRSQLAVSAGMNLSREKMCQIPVGAIAVDNPRGVAPGVVCRLSGGAAVICLPGHPAEARAVLDQAWNELGEPARRFGVAYREVESPTSDESSLRPLLERIAGEFPNVWISSRTVGPGRQGQRVVVTFEATGATAEDAQATLGSAVKRLLDLAGGSL